MRTRLMPRTMISGLLLALVVIFLYFFADRTISNLARDFADTPLHLWAERISLLANHTVVFSLAAFGLPVAAYNLLGDAPRDWAKGLALVCLSVLAAIALVESVKFVFGRCRPALLFDKGLYGFTWFSEDYLRNSFPSGHTTRIFALAVSLSLLVRRAALPALLLAVLVGICRVLALKHFASDVLAGAWCGSMAAIWMHAAGSLFVLKKQ